MQLTLRLGVCGANAKNYGSVTVFIRNCTTVRL
jgi:hypothetical protein